MLLLILVPYNMIQSSLQFCMKNKLKTLKTSGLFLTIFIYNILLAKKVSKIYKKLNVKTVLFGYFFLNNL